MPKSEIYKWPVLPVSEINPPRPVVEINSLSNGNRNSEDCEMCMSICILLSAVHDYLMTRLGFDENHLGARIERYFNQMTKFDHCNFWKLLDEKAAMNDHLSSVVSRKFRKNLSLFWEKNFENILWKFHANIVLKFHENIFLKFHKKITKKTLE